MERLREFGILPSEHGLSKYATGERQGRIVRPIDQQTFTRKWCIKKHNQAVKAGHSAWAEMLDDDMKARDEAETNNFPRVLRHWNTDTVSGRLLPGPELVVCDLETNYLDATRSSTHGVIEPSDAIQRPRL